jgi:tetratricopeptide (TPR) repeat protein
MRLGRHARSICRNGAAAILLAVFAGFFVSAPAVQAQRLAALSVKEPSVPHQNTCPNAEPAEAFAAPDPAYRRRYNTIVHELLDDEASVADVTPAMYAILDTLIDEAKASLRLYQPNMPADEETAFAEDALNRIDCILLRHGFVYPGHGLVQLLRDGLEPTRYDDAAALNELQGEEHNVRRARFIKARGAGPFYVVDCDIASFIYLGIAEVMNYPLHLIDLPNHNFVRWQSDAGKPVDYKPVDYETMDGAVTDDDYYRRNWNIPERFIGKGGVLKSMSTIEVFAYHDSTVAISWSWRGDYARMVDFYQRAISRDPTRAFSANNLAWFYAAVPKLELRDGKKAIDYAKRAVELFPGSDNLDTLACAYAQAGDFKRAQATMAEAIAVGYLPFGSSLNEDMALLKQHRTCNDPKFGVDPQPFRPPQSAAGRQTDDSVSRSQ